jgi:catechol 2,3-dioxygenase-like lactoylglutathione lyase family enzyme
VANDEIVDQSVDNIIGAGYDAAGPANSDVAASLGITPGDDDRLTPMISHVSIQCADASASAAFYDAVLAPLGGSRMAADGDAIGYGVPPLPDFWIAPQRTGEGFRETHFAFRAPDRAAVRAFFEAAVGTGAEVLHEPQVWPQYHPNYYGAFVRDPDGNNVEAVCHSPE